MVCSTYRQQAGNQHPRLVMQPGGLAARDKQYSQACINAFLESLYPAEHFVKSYPANNGSVAL